MTQFKKVGAIVDGNATKKVDKGSNNPLPHGLMISTNNWSIDRMWWGWQQEVSGSRERIV